MPDDKSQNESTPEFIEQWVILREAQGWTREAALADLNIAAGKLDTAIKASEN
jgi:hypothetical protein